MDILQKHSTITTAVLLRVAARHIHNYTYHEMLFLKEGPRLVHSPETRLVLARAQQQFRDVPAFS